MRKRKKEGVDVWSLGLPGRLRKIQIHDSEGRLDFGSLLIVKLVNLLRQPVIFQSALHQEHVINRVKVPSLIIEHYSGFERQDCFPKITNGIPIFAVSPGLAAALSRKLGRNVEVIGNPVNKSFLSNSEHRRSSKLDVKLLLIARHIHVKNLPDSIRALQQILTAQKTWSATIVTDTSKFNDAHERIEIIPKYGQLSSDEILRLMSEADVICSFSITETFGLTIAESLSLGKPVIATPTSGAQYLIEEGKNGFLASGFSAEDIELVLEKVNLAKSLKSEEIKESVVHLSPHRWSQRILEELAKKSEQKHFSS